MARCTSVMRDPMQIQETDGSHSEFSLHPGPNMELFSENIYGARICCDGDILCDEEDDLAKYSKDGDFKRRIGEDPSEPGVTCIRKFFVDSSGLIYLPKKRKVKVYSPNGTFSQTIEYKQLW